MIRTSRRCIIGFVLIYFILIFLSAGCTDTKEGMKTNAVSAASSPTAITEIELYHFHGNQQCVSCILLGDMAEEVVKTYYADDLASGKLIFAHVNYDDLKYAELARKYEVSSSSIMIGVHTKDSFAKADIVQLWYRIHDKNAYTTVLRGILDPLLKGEPS